MRLSGVARLDGTAADIDTQARALSASNAKLVITVADTIGSAQFLRTFRRYSPATFVAGTSLTNLATLREIAGARATEYTVFSQVVPNPDTSATPLQGEHIDMMRKFRDEPSSPVTLEGFAVAKTLARAIAQEAAGKGGLQAIAATRTTIDIGGMTLISADQGQNMSRYVDIALFKRGGGLMY